MNIFNLPLKEIDKKMKEILSKTTPEKVLSELIECGYKEVTMKDEEAIKKLKQMISLNQFIIINQPTDVEGNKDLNDEIKAMNYVLNLIEKQKAEIKKLNFYLSASEQEHNHDIKMIDEVKGEAVKLYKEIETLKRDFEMVDHECNRLEQEDIRKDKIINEMVNFIKGLDIDFADICNTRIVRQCDGPQCKDCIIKYIENKVKESK